MLIIIYLLEWYSSICINRFFVVFFFSSVAINTTLGVYCGSGRNKNHEPLTSVLVTKITIWTLRVSNTVENKYITTRTIWKIFFFFIIIVLYESHYYPRSREQGLFFFFFMSNYNRPRTNSIGIGIPWTQNENRKCLRTNCLIKAFAE